MAFSPPISCAAARLLLLDDYYGGTFGMTRNGGTKKHTGVDIAATPGTELYAMYSGTVHMVQTKYNEDKYVKGSYGNEIVINQYSHLHYREPIAINPRTRLPFKEGDEVFEGDMIAYSGKTGNAYRDKDVPNKHLHLGVSTDWQVSRRNNNWIDPAPFPNGTINVDKNHPYSGGTIDNIKCD